MTTDSSDALDALKQAVENEQVVSFMYNKKPSEGGSVRTLSPYELSGDIAEGNVKILGWDHDREAIRSFKIEKIVGQVSPQSIEFQEPK